MTTGRKPVFVKNPFCDGPPSLEKPAITEIREVRKLHESLPTYSSTPLISLPTLAYELKIKNALVKDEGQRFGLKAFKALGSSYALYRWLKEELGSSAPAPGRFYRGAQERLKPNTYCFATATDGNHGRGVAWLAEILRQRAVIFVPEETVKPRIDAIASHGARVVAVEGGYDEAVKKCREEAEANHWIVISDTSWDGYRKIPDWIAEGYYTLFDEIRETLGDDAEPDLVIVQGGVGALAASAASYYSQSKYRDRVTIAIVEPVEAACLTESILTKDARPVRASGELKTVMAGLNCGFPSPAAWPPIRQRVELFLTITDEDCRSAMRRYYRPQGGDRSIVSGESGAAGLAGLLRWSEHFGLDPTSTVLLINTEADTHPESFRKIVRQ